MPAGVSQGLTRVETGPRRWGPERAAVARAGEQGSTGGTLPGTGVRVPMWKGVRQSDPGPGQPTLFKRLQVCCVAYKFEVTELTGPLL